MLRYIPIGVVRFALRQHEQIKSSFVGTLAASGNATERAFVELRRLLAAHETAEEEIVHPPAKRKIPNGDKIIGALLDEEREAKTVLAGLKKLDVDTQSFTDMLTKLRGAVVEHTEQEEKQEFIKLDQELGDDALQHLGRAAKLAEVIAPTRPHAGVESQVDLFAGPFHGDDGPGTRHHHRQGLA